MKTWLLQIARFIFPIVLFFFCLAVFVAQDLVESSAPDWSRFDRFPRWLQVTLLLLALLAYLPTLPPRRRREASSESKDAT